MLKVFLVEDEFVVREGIKKNIDWESHGYQFCGEASDGELAFPLIKKEMPDIVITDIRMPFMNGLELSKLIKKEMPWIEIIILTGFEEFEYAKEGIKIGVARYLSKPISGDDLISELNALSEKIEQNKKEREIKEKYLNEMKEDTINEKKLFFEKLVTGTKSAAELIEDAEKLDMNISSIFYSIMLVNTTVKAHSSDEFSKRLVDIDEEIENKDYINLKKDVSNNDINLGWNNIRTVDNELFHKNRRNYVMNMYNEDLDVSVSGLDLSLPDRKTFSLIQDIYYAGIDNISDKDQSAIMDTASSYGLISEYGLNLSFRFNYEELSLKGPIVVQSRIADKANDRIYTVYHLRKNGDIVKCKSVFTNNYIIFEADEEGAYLVLSKDSFNIYDNSDTVENLEKADTGIDEHKVNIEFLVVMVLVITNFIGVLVYYIVNSRKEEKWRDYRKSLQTQASVHEGKRKN